MEYTELINDFIDGRLDTGQEEELFLALASSEELRTELRESYMLESAFGEDFNSLKPSTKSTMGVFSKVGIPLPVPDGVVPAGGDAGAGAAGSSAGSGSAGYLAGKFGSVILSSLVTALTAVSVYFVFLQPDNTMFGDDYYSAADEKIITDNNVPVAGNYENSIIEKADLAADLGRTRGRNTRIISVEKNNDDNISQKSETAIQDNISDYSWLDGLEKQAQAPVFDGIFNVNEDDFGELAVLNSHTPDMNSEFSDAYIPSPRTYTTNTDKKWSVEVHGAIDEPVNVNPVMDYSTNPEFRNSGFGLYYKFADNLMAGLDVRQEYFYQEYQGKQPDGSYRYYQYPNYTTINLGFRYYFYEDRLLGLLDMDLYGQVMAGFDNKLVGFIPRAALGAEISWTPDFKFIIGVDGAGMLYKHGGKVFDSKKWGIHYGIGFNF